MSREPDDNWKMRLFAFEAMGRFFERWFERRARALEAEVANDG
jgi:hypothetical protein